MNQSDNKPTVIALCFLPDARHFAVMGILLSLRHCSQPGWFYNHGSDLY